VDRGGPADCKLSRLPSLLVYSVIGCEFVLLLMMWGWVGLREAANDKNNCYKKLQTIILKKKQITKHIYIQHNNEEKSYIWPRSTHSLTTASLRRREGHVESQTTAEHRRTRRVRREQNKITVLAPHCIRALTTGCIQLTDRPSRMPRPLAMGLASGHMTTHTT